MHESELAQKIDWAVPFMFADTQQAKYFKGVFTRHLTAMQLHADAGLWDPRDGKPDWANISGHCGFVAARSRLLTRMAGMSLQMQNLAEAAGLLHDIGKRNEVLYTKAHNRGWDSFAVANKMAEDFLRNAGIDSDLIRIAGSCGHGSLLEMRGLVSEGYTPNEIDVLCLIVSLVDDYSVGTEYVLRVSDGKNAIDRRIEANLAATNYALLNEQGKKHFGGKSTFTFQGEVAILKQSFLARMVMRVTDTDFDPIRLPEMVEAELVKEIQAAQ